MRRAYGDLGNWGRRDLSSCMWRAAGSGGWGSSWPLVRTTGLLVALDPGADRVLTQCRGFTDLRLVASLPVQYCSEHWLVPRLGCKAHHTVRRQVRGAGPHWAPGGRRMDGREDSPFQAGSRMMMHYVLVMSTFIFLYSVPCWHFIMSYSMPCYLSSCPR